jgi:hypothetical protein
LTVLQTAQSYDLDGTTLGEAKVELGHELLMDEIAIFTPIF